MFEIKNEHFSVGINEIGAELEYIKIDGINILWSRGGLWNQQSPILFPIIGALKDNYYLAFNKKYEMEPHGFIQNARFDLLAKSDTSIALFKEYDEESLKLFPFKFRLEIIFSLHFNTLQIRFKVRNLGDEKMPFSIGIHPGFSYQGLDSLLGRGYKIDFNPKILDEYEFSPIFINGKRQALIDYNSFSEISATLVDKRTLCYEGLNEINFIGSYNKLSIKHTMDSTAIWQKNPEANNEFMCIEGWCGLPDEIDSDHIIFNKKNEHIVDSNCEFCSSFSISYM